MKRADVFLDTIGFSGFNTAMQAAECALPIVTREGRFMRGRLASGMLRSMGMSDLVAADEKAMSIWRSNSHPMPGTAVDPPAH
jgi:predicted O-linked N-acetylglucosamine transferase (SPINDLY family)